MASEVSPTSSRKTAPPLAYSNSPGCASVAPINAPRTYPMPRDFSREVVRCASRMARSSAARIFPRRRPAACASPIPRHEKCSRRCCVRAREWRPPYEYMQPGGQWIGNELAQKRSQANAGKDCGRNLRSVRKSSGRLASRGADPSGHSCCCATSPNNDGRCFRTSTA
jgi:hypothetical protein